MKYRNIKTGAIIDVNAEVSGEDWEALNSSSPAISDSDEPVESKKAPKGKRKQV